MKRQLDTSSWRFGNASLVYLIEIIAYILLHLERLTKPFDVPPTDK